MNRAVPGAGAVAVPGRPRTVTDLARRRSLLSVSDIVLLTGWKRGKVRSWIDRGSFPSAHINWHFRHFVEAERFFRIMRALGRPFDEELAKQLGVEVEAGGQTTPR